MKRIVCVDRSNYTVPVIPNWRRKVLAAHAQEKFCGKQIISFISTLEKDPDIDLNIYFNNLRSLRFLKNDTFFNRYKEILSKNGTLYAYYSPLRNTVYFDDFSTEQD